VIEAALAWPLLDAALRGALVLLLLMMAATLGRERAREPWARVALALALGLCVQTVVNTPWIDQQVPALWLSPWVAISAGNAVLFWLLVRCLLDDDFALRPWHAGVWATVLLISGLRCALRGPASPYWVPGLAHLQAVIPLLFTLLVVWASLRQWRADLVDARRGLRAFIVVAGSVYTLASMAARWSAPQGRVGEVAALWDVLALLLMVAVLAWRVLRWAVGDWMPRSAPVAAVAQAEPVPFLEQLETARPPVPDALPPVATLPPAEQAPALADDAPLVAAVRQLMLGERVYREEGLTIASLAARLAVPEYRLRRAINQTLGFRNFNAFVNRYRLDECRAALANPALAQRAVLDIALEAGFQSIGPFNRAFKLDTGLTPSEYRRLKASGLAES
jgi:AraC-like DNA-binding protein